MKRKLRYVTKSITIAPGTTTTQQLVKTVLDGSYDRIIGIVAYEVANASNDMYKIALTHGDVVIQESTHKNDWIGSTSVPFCERYKPLNLGAKEETLVTVTPHAALVGTVTIDVVFILEKDNVC
jgi:hypothetical protein